MTCSFTIDNVVDSATYDVNTLTITGDDLSNWKTEKSVTFESCHDLSPGTLVIKGSNDEGEGTLCSVNHVTEGITQESPMGAF